MVNHFPRCTNLIVRRLSCHRQRMNENRRKGKNPDLVQDADLIVGVVTVEGGTVVDGTVGIAGLAMIARVAKPGGWIGHPGTGHAVGMVMMIEPSLAGLALLMTG